MVPCQAVDNIDETHNLTPQAVKAIPPRTKEGTRIVLAGNIGSIRHISISGQTFLVTS